MGTHLCLGIGFDAEECPRWNVPKLQRNCFGEVDMGVLKLLKNKATKHTARLVMIMALLAIFSTVLMASYVYRVDIRSYFATAVKDFYFTSNLLTDQENIPTYQISHNWQSNNPATISFELRNYQDPLNASTCDIAYNVKTTPVGSATSGTIIAGGAEGNKKAINLNIPAPQTVAPVEVLVTATATAPYSKILRGKFIITPAISYQLAENADSPLATLEISLAQSTEPTREVTISWPQGAAPDMTNPLVMAAANGGTLDLTSGTLTTTLNTAAVYELIFFKDQAETEYTGVTVSGS